MMQMLLSGANLQNVKHEEIQKCTGAVVITRGKYHPPNSLPDNDKPLYLHISAGAHLKDTPERIKAVDHAASIVEEILKQGQSSQLAAFLSVYNSGQVVQPLTKCLYLGFDPDPTLNIVARIQGPDDQYINHIMIETGVNVMLRGQGLGNAELPHAHDAQEPLHLYLSGNNSKNLEDARILAENLLDTICLECGVSRVSACKGYKAVPPPQKLDGVESSGNLTGSSASISIFSTIDSAAAKPSFTTVAHVSSGSNICSPRSLLQHGSLVNFCQNPHASVVSYSQPSMSRGTSYSGYGGIYPQATPLQQVALALRQVPASPASFPATPIFSAKASTCTVSNLTSSSGADKDKRPQRRKFQELPVASNSPTASYQTSRQGSESLKPGVSSDDLPVKNASSMSPPKLVQLHSNGMPPACPRNTFPPPPLKIMPPPPPPPKFTALITEPVPDTLMKLMEYGEEDEDAGVSSEEYSKHNSTPKTTAKLFWAG